MPRKTWGEYTLHPVIALLAVATTGLLAATIISQASDQMGAARGLVLGTSTTGDEDGDGIVDSKDLDRDGDGFANIFDPLPDAPKDLDNDGLVNAKDKDDDGDGVPDTKDFAVDKNTGKKTDRSLDQDNDGKRDEKERHEKGLKWDGDKDGRPDIAEMISVVTAEAQRRGVKLGQVKSLADVPSTMMRDMPRGWNFVMNDQDNDGKPNGMDNDGNFTKVANAFAAYGGGGQWEKTYQDFAKRGGDNLGFVPRCLACEGMEHGNFTIPKYEVPHWERSGSSGSGGTSSGAHSYEDYAKYFGKADNSYRDVPQFSGGDYKPASSYSGGSSTTNSSSDGGTYSSGTTSSSGGDSGSYSGGGSSGGGDSGGYTSGTTGGDSGGGYH